MLRWLAGFVIAMCAPCAFAAQPPARVDGRHAGGAPWAIEMPAQWNGTLLLYSRGYSADRRETPPDTAPRGLHDWLLTQGYALAASSYSGEGWALEEAPRDQIEVLDAFVARFGTPRRTIAWGSSMGGLVSLALAERHPERFTGALPFCGSVSGSVGMLNTALDGAFAFQVLVAPDQGIRVTGVDDDRANAARVRAALDEAWKTPQGRARVMLAGALAQLPLWTDPASPEPAPGDDEAQAEQVRRTFAMGTFVPRTDQERRAGGVTSWNTGVDYARQLEASGRAELVRRWYARAGLDLDADLARLAAAPRIAADAGAVEWFRANYVPTGNLRIPVLTLQTIGDGITVPATQGSLRRFVAEAGRESMLGQLWVHGAGHCTFTPAELAASLRTLESRIATGRWQVDPDSATRAGAGLPGGTRFTRHDEPELLRHCGAKPGSCAGEPASRKTPGSGP
jgi:pimeloyl-ACP methyl ester carboxylesterase